MYHMKSTCNKHNKLLEKLRESEEAEGGGGGVQTHKNFIYCSRPFQLVPKERTLGQEVEV